MAPSLPPQPLNPTALMEKYKSQIEALIKDHVQSDVDREKVYQYAQARKHEMYWRGVQYLKPVVVGGNVVDWGPSGTVNPETLKEERKNQFDYVINMIRGDGRKFSAVLGQRSPNVKAMPNRGDNETFVRRARKADSAAEFLRAAWEVEKKHRHLAMSLWKNGTTFAYTTWVSDPDKYGTVENELTEFRDVKVGEGSFRCIQCGAMTPESQMQGACSGCGAPVGAEDYVEPPMAPVPETVKRTPFPNGCVELRLCTVFTVTTPFYCETTEQLPWLWYEYEEHKGAIIAAHPELEDWKGDDAETNATGITQQGRMSRDLASSPTGAYIAPRKNRWTYSRFWLTPSMFSLVVDKELRAQLRMQFPGGLKVTSVNGRLVKMEAEKLADVWSACKPETSEYMYADAICKDYLPAQDLLNDHTNMGAEMWERAIPVTFGDPRVIDFRKLRQHAGLPGEVIPIIPGTGNQLHAAMHTPKPAEPNPQMMAFADAIKEQTREVVGVLKPIFGADSANQTATEAEQKRTQALMQLNTTWNEMRDFWAKTYQNGVMQLAKYAVGGISINGASLSDEEIADLKELLDGGWHFEAEEAMPMTWNQRRALVFSILDKPPQVWPILGMQHPLNAADIQQTLGMTGWKTPMLDARDKTLDTIRQLLQESPIVQTGPMGVDVLPSIPVDEFEDDHAFVVQVVREWAQEHHDLKVKNPEGYQNVIAWGKQHFVLAQPPVPVGPDGAPLPPPGGPGAPPPPDGMSDGMAAPPPSGGVAEPPPEMGAAEPQAA